MIALFTYPRRTARTYQSGASLVMSLIILIVIALLGVTAMTISNTQYKQAGNVQYQNVAFNQAEAALADAANWLYTGTNRSNDGFNSYSTTTPQLYPIGYFASQSQPNNDPLTISWGDGNSRAVNGYDGQRYLIEKVAAAKTLPGTSLSAGGLSSTGCNQADVFRITTRGTSARGTVKFVQTYQSVLSC